MRGVLRSATGWEPGFARARFRPAAPPLQRGRLLGVSAQNHYGIIPAPEGLIRASLKQKAARPGRSFFLATGAPGRGSSSSAQPGAPSPDITKHSVPATRASPVRRSPHPQPGYRDPLVTGGLTGHGDHVPGRAASSCALGSQPARGQGGARQEAEAARYSCHCMRATGMLCVSAQSACDP